MTATIQQPAFTETRVFDFVKDRGKGYLELPVYDGSRDDLRIVSGADTWLDMLSSNGTQVSMRISLNELLPDRIERFFEMPSIGGEYNQARLLNGKRMNHLMWIISVIIFLFGKHPDFIHYKVC